MAININRVYQTVLALANKEQRGYITPQEFNLFANHAQLEIFDQYFHDLDQAKRRPGNQSNYGDKVGMIQDKINNYIVNSGSFDLESNSGSYQLPSTQWHSIASVSIDGIPAEKLDREVQHVYKTALLKPNKSKPIFYILNNSVQFNPKKGNASLSFIRKPASPNWAYVVVGDKPMYDPSRSIDFDLHVSEEKDLVVKIAQLCGVSIQDFALTQAAGAKESSIIQQEKV